MYFPRSIHGSFGDSHYQTYKIYNNNFKNENKLEFISVTSWKFLLHLKTFTFYPIFFLYLRVYMWGACHGRPVKVTDNLSELLFSSPHEGSENWTAIFRLGNNPLWWWVLCHVDTSCKHLRLSKLGGVRVSQMVLVYKVWRSHWEQLRLGTGRGQQRSLMKVLDQ